MAASGGSSQLRRDYFWNSAASLMGAASLVIILTIVTRAAGVAAAGVFSLANNAIGQQFQTLGMYEVRAYQVTDVRGRFSFGVYHATRIVTVTLMTAGIIGYAACRSASAALLPVIILIALLRIFDAYEDVFFSEFQRCGQLDTGGRASFFRILTTTVVFSIVIVMTKSLLWSAIAALVITTAVTVALYIPPAKRLFSIRPVWSTRAIREVLIECLPLFLSSFLAMYLSNAPRYAIDRYLDLDAQGYFGILYMPATAINLLSLLVFRPLLTRMAGHWTRGDWPAFAGLVMRGLRTTFIAFVLVSIVAWAAGVPILAFVFSTDLSPYRPELMVLIAGGALNAAGVILYYALTTMRLQHFVFLAYVIAAAAATALSWLLVPTLALLGAALTYTAAIGVLAAVLAVGIVRARPRPIRSSPLPSDDSGPSPSQ